MPHMANLPWTYIYMTSFMLMLIFMIMMNFNEKIAINKNSKETMKDKMNKNLHWKW